MVSGIRIDQVLLTGMHKVIGQIPKNMVFWLFLNFELNSRTLPLYANAWVIELQRVNYTRNLTNLKSRS